LVICFSTVSIINPNLERYLFSASFCPNRIGAHSYTQYGGRAVALAKSLICPADGNSDDKKPTKRFFIVTSDSFQT
jgi:hypothetical protein